MHEQGTVGIICTKVFIVKHEHKLQRKYCNLRSSIMRHTDKNIIFRFCV